MYIYSYALYVEKFKYPQGFKIRDFSLSNGESSLSYLEYVACFTTQYGMQTMTTMTIISYVCSIIP